MKLKAWHSPTDIYYHVCTNCPDAPPAEVYPEGPLKYQVRRGRGGKKICGKCLDLMHERKCKRVDKVPMADICFS